MSKDGGVGIDKPFTVPTYLSGRGYICIWKRSPGLTFCIPYEKLKTHRILGYVFTQWWYKIYRFMLLLLDAKASFIKVYTFLGCIYVKDSASTTVYLSMRCWFPIRIILGSTIKAELGNDNATAYEICNCNCMKYMGRSTCYWILYHVIWKLYESNIKKDMDC